MARASDYRRRPNREWQLWVLPEWWSDGLQSAVLERVREQPPSRHPQTLTFDFPGVRGKQDYFLKIFHRNAISEAAKDLFRPSKARRFWRQGLALAAAGFNVPLTIAAGDSRGFRVLRRGFVLTLKINGEPLPEFLLNGKNNRTAAQSLKQKRNNICRLADLVRQFHDRGFVHGDLVATNLLIAPDEENGLQFYFMDNDRTRCFPVWLPQPLWKRNLIQLNRMPLAGIMLEDRMRFLSRYLRRRRLAKRDRHFARWLEEKTRRRRCECDGVDPKLNFRRLMAYL